MADNIQITEGSGTILRTTDNGGVHTPHHIVASSALPAGAATSANQDTTNTRIGNTTDAEATGNGSVIAILKRIRTILAGTLTFALPTGASTTAKQDEIISTLDAIGEALDDVLAAINQQKSFVLTVAVTPDDDTDLPNGTCQGVIVTADGNLQYRAAAATTGSTTIPVVAGMVLPISVSRILEGTTATVLAGYTVNPT